MQYSRWGKGMREVFLQINIRSLSLLFELFFLLTFDSLLSVSSHHFIDRLPPLPFTLYLFCKTILFLWNPPSSFSSYSRPISWFPTSSWSWWWKPLSLSCSSSFRSIYSFVFPFCTYFSFKNAIGVKSKEPSLRLSWSEVNKNVSDSCLFLQDQSDMTGYKIF